MEAEGIVLRLLHGPKGEARGVLLQDGRIIRFPAHEAERIMPLVSTGRALAARGEGLSSALGVVIDARELGTSMDDLHPFEPPKPKREKHRDHDAAPDAA